MLIVIEGCDGSGKTVLTKKLEDAGYETIYVPRKDNSDKLWERLAKKPLVISDRSFLSDVVYRLIDDDYVGTSLQGHIDIIKHGLKIIHCETDTSYADSILRGEDNITDKSVSDRIKKMYNIIIKFYNKFGNVPVLKFNWCTQDFNEVIDFINNTRVAPVNIENK